MNRAAAADFPTNVRLGSAHFAIITTIIITLIFILMIIIFMLIIALKFIITIIFIDRLRHPRNRQRVGGLREHEEEKNKRKTIEKTP